MATGTIKAGILPITEGGTGATTQYDAAKNIARIYHSHGQGASLTVPLGRYLMLIVRYSSYVPFNNWRMSFVGGVSGGGTSEVEIVKSTGNTLGVTLSANATGLTVTGTSSIYADLFLMCIS